jgi:uncharacterized membrane protein
MLSKLLLSSKRPRPNDFNWRGREVSRIEGLSDCVFAFAVTLFVASLEVPKTFSELLTVMQGFLVFAVCFANLMIVWYQQYVFHRRYGLQDPVTIALSCWLLGLVIFYVYPLKFLWTVLLQNTFAIRETSANTATIPLHISELPTLMLIYSGGFVLVSLIFLLMYLHAYRQRKVLELTQLETILTEESIFHIVGDMSVGLVSIGLAMTGPQNSGFAGMIYMLLGPMHAIVGTYTGRKRKRLALG